MNPPFSERFGDIYFSGEDGLAETRHVFLKGNGLPEAWRERLRFTIAETGFGTGLNFLASWMLFEATAPADAVLDYIAIELYPLSACDIREALEPWAAEFEGRLDAMLSQWPLRVPGFHRLHFPRVRLTLVFDDVNDALPQLTVPRGVDSWFLDGFAPAKNPQMWSGILYGEMARLSAPAATVATFTAAGAVRRGLAEAGFLVDKVPGFGRKRDMTVARFGGKHVPETKRPGSVAVIGGGLAGTACAEALQRRGIETVIYEAGSSLAAGASGNRVGLCNPRFFAHRTPQSDFYASAYAMAARRFAGMKDIGFVSCGSLHLVNSNEKEKRFVSMQDKWGWDKAHLDILSVSEASEKAGVGLTRPSLYLADSGQVDLVALCRAYANGITVHTANSAAAQQSCGGLWTVGGRSFDAVVLAGGPGMAATTALPVHTVRGQVTMVRATEKSLGLNVNLCYGGYMSAPFEGVHMVGSTFQKWLTDANLRSEDDDDNLTRLAENVPALAGHYEIVGSRAALRLTSRDHFPVAGKLQENLFVSTAHASHGILSSLACGEVLADMMDCSPSSLSGDSLRALAPDRFL